MAFTADRLKRFVVLSAMVAAGAAVEYLSHYTVQKVALSDSRALCAHVWRVRGYSNSLRALAKSSLRCAFPGLTSIVCAPNASGVLFRAAANYHLRYEANPCAFLRSILS